MCCPPLPPVPVLRQDYFPLPSIPAPAANPPLPPPSLAPKAPFLSPDGLSAPKNTTESQKPVCKVDTSDNGSQSSSENTVVHLGTNDNAVSSATPRSNVYDDPPKAFHGPYSVEQAPAPVRQAPPVKTQICDVPVKAPPPKKAMAHSAHSTEQRTVPTLECQRDAIRVAAAAATAVMLEMGVEHPLTKQFLGIVQNMLPSGWVAAGWSNNQLYWYDTVAEFTTWTIPVRPAGDAPDPGMGAVGMVFQW